MKICVVFYLILIILCFFLNSQINFLISGYFLRIKQFQTKHFSEFAEPYFYTKRAGNFCDKPF